jgi:hypothetical protein
MSSPTSKFFATQIIHRPHPEAVIYDLTSTSSTRITLPSGSTWSSGLHWHKTYTEYLRLIQGSIRVVLGNEEHIITAQPEQIDSDQNVLVVEIGVRHEWCRAVVDDGVEVIVEESTDPRDGMKTVFFWAVNAVVLEGIEQIKSSKSAFGRWFAEWLLWWKLMIVFWELDNRPVMYGSRADVQSLSTFGVLALSSFLGSFCRLDVIREDTMPVSVWEMWLKKKEAKLD